MPLTDCFAEKGIQLIGRIVYLYYNLMIHELYYFGRQKYPILMLLGPMVNSIRIVHCNYHFKIQFIIVRSNCHEACAE